MADTEARREYKREWQRRNKDKMKEAFARYWEKKADANPETATGADAKREYAREWQRRNKDKVKEYNTRYAQKKKDAAQGMKGGGQ